MKNEFLLNFYIYFFNPLFHLFLIRKDGNGVPFPLNVFYSSKTSRKRKVKKVVKDFSTLSKLQKRPPLPKDYVPDRLLSKRKLKRRLYNRRRRLHQKQMKKKKLKEISIINNNLKKSIPVVNSQSRNFKKRERKRELKKLEQKIIEDKAEVRALKEHWDAPDTDDFVDDWMSFDFKSDQSSSDILPASNKIKLIAKKGKKVNKAKIRRTQKRFFKFICNKDIFDSLSKSKYEEMFQRNLINTVRVSFYYGKHNKNEKGGYQCVKYLLEKYYEVKITKWTVEFKKKAPHFPDLYDFSSIFNKIDILKIFPAAIRCNDIKPSGILEIS